MYKRVLVSLAAFALAVVPALTSGPTIHAAAGDLVTFGTGASALTFTRGLTSGGGTVTNEVNGCDGPMVAVYGSSALANYVKSTSVTYCQDVAHNATHIDVEYLGGGDSCPGEIFAGTYAAATDGDPLGGSDVYGGPCVSLGANPNAFNDNIVSVNLVQLIMNCPGANTPGGGVTAAEIIVANQVPCQGSGSGAAGSKTYAAPNNLGLDTMKIQLKGTIPNWSKLGGANVPDAQAQRATGSGTRITMCYNIFAGLDSSCGDDSTVGATSTTGAMENAVCGAYGASSIGDAAGTLGYSSRSGTLATGQGGNTNNFTTLALVPVENCGIVALNGTTGWNNQCDATNPTTGTGAETNNVDSTLQCPGDFDVLNGNYPAWGFEHFDTNIAETGSDPATAYLNWIPGHNGEMKQLGFMLNCQMNVTRGYDAGPVSLSGASC